MKKQRRGITLVALVITIIILLILAAITINLTVGQRGILNMAKEAGRNYGEAAKREDETLSNFLKEADDIINEINGNEGGSTPNTPEQPVIDIATLKTGDYIKYDTGVTSVGTNGVITCRVLYPVDSEFGLQIISADCVGPDISLGGSGWSDGKTGYNGAIETLNSESERYVNQEYAYDGRSVGSLPTVRGGMFVDKNKLRDSEGNVNDFLDSVSIPDTFTLPSGWTSRDTGLSAGDRNYVEDLAAINTFRPVGAWSEFWLASRFVSVNEAEMRFRVRTGLISSVSAMAVIEKSSTRFGGKGKCGLRPCISLKVGVIKITGGDGTSEDTAYIIGK